MYLNTAGQAITDLAIKYIWFYYLDSADGRKGSIKPRVVLSTVTPQRLSSAIIFAEITSTNMRISPEVDQDVLPDKPKSGKEQLP